MSLVDRARSFVEGPEPDEDEPRFSDSPRWGQETELYRKALRKAYSHLEDVGEATTGELREGMDIGVGDHWFYTRGLPTLRAEPGVRLKGWTISEIVHPLDDEELRERVADLHDQEHPQADFVAALTRAAYKELRDADHHMTRMELEECARKRANRRAGDEVWRRVDRHLTQLGVTQPSECVWMFDGEAGDE